MHDFINFAFKSIISYREIIKSIGTPKSAYNIDLDFIIPIF